MCFVRSGRRSFILEEINVVGVLKCDGNEVTVTEVKYVGELKDDGAAISLDERAKVEGDDSCKSRTSV